MDDSIKHLSQLLDDDDDNDCDPRVNSVGSRSSSLLDLTSIFVYLFIFRATVVLCMCVV